MNEWLDSELIYAFALYLFEMGLIFIIISAGTAIFLWTIKKLF